MTAIVGILNRQAVALAADSAATIRQSQNNKVLNQSNKIFALSRHQPIAIALCGKDCLMGMPWETLIKVYRKQLSEKALPTLRDYADDFFRFLYSKNFYTTQEEQKEQFVTYVFSCIHYLEEIFEDKKEMTINSFLAEQETIFNKKKQCNWTTNINEIRSIISENQALALKSLKTGEDDKSIEILKSPELIDTLMAMLESEWGGESTSLIFTGFGENEIYPKMISFNVSIVYNNNLRYYEEGQANVSNSEPAHIVPFGQTDVVETILYGISPTLEGAIKRAVHNFFEQFSGSLLANNLKMQISLDANKLAESCMQAIAEAKNEHFETPLNTTLSFLNKEDLAEIAESLIYSTYLNRRSTQKEEGVGGAIDVAILTKGDGLIWIKRKHYFDARLNQHFFKNQL